MKKLTLIGAIESGILGIAQGKVAALTPTLQPGGLGLGLAIANEPGYYPVPLFWCNGDSYEELAEHADEMNRELFKLEPETAMSVVSSSMRAGKVPR